MEEAIKLLKNHLAGLKDAEQTVAAKVDDVQASLDYHTTTLTAIREKAASLQAAIDLLEMP